MPSSARVVAKILELIVFLLFLLFIIFILLLILISKLHVTGLRPPRLRSGRHTC